ncbi:MAG: DNA internalization-related competence protein ComEC/Rec2 [Calditrichia bacterium]
MQKSLNLSLGYLSIAFLLLGIAAILYRKNFVSLGILLSGLIILGGAWNYAHWSDRNLDHPLRPYLPLNLDSAQITVRHPPPADSRRFLGELERISFQGKNYPLNRKVTLSMPFHIPDLLPGDRIFLTHAELREIDPPRNPGQFNYKKYLQQQGVFAEIQANEFSHIRVEKPNHTVQFSRLFYQMSEKLEGRIHALLPDSTAYFLSAVLLGKREAISPETKRDFQNTGVAHVLAISGLHVGFVVLIIYLVLSFLPLHFRWHNWLTILVLLIYMFVTGAKSPVVRATLMISLYLIGMNLERKPRPYNILYTAGFLILLIQPQQLFWVSFQFSFVAVFSILFFYRRLKPLENRISRPLAHLKIRRAMQNGLVQPFLVSLAAQLGTIPLMAFYFHKIPIISFLLNLLVIPLIGFIVSMGFLMLGFSLISLHLGALISTFLSQTIILSTQIVHRAAQIPYAYIPVPTFPSLLILIYIFTLGILFIWTKADYRPIRIPAVGLILVFVLWLYHPQITPTQVIMLDVGQGESSLVRTRENRLLLFDAGPVYSNFDSGRDAILPAVQEIGKLSLHRVFISHPHADHLGGLFFLASATKIDTVYLTHLKTTYHLQDSIQHVLQKHQIPFRFLEMGDIVPIDRYTRAYVLGPPPVFLSPTGTSGAEINNTSLVILLKTSDGSILFTGDSERGVEKELLSWGSTLDCDVLKLGHHGSYTSSSAAFLNAVSPLIGLIPVGRDNRYDHPSRFILEQLQKSGISFYRTDQVGAVWLKAKNKKWEYVDWRNL